MYIEPVNRLIATLAIAGIAAGCTEAPAAQHAFTLATGSTGGIYHPLGDVIAERMSQVADERMFTAAVTGGSVENIHLVLEGEADLGFAISTSVHEAYRGGTGFDSAATALRIVAPLYPNLTHVLVAPGVTARNVSDLRGLRVSVGPEGSGTEQLARQLLDAYQLTYADVAPTHLSFSESAAALARGDIDAAILSVGRPAAAVRTALQAGARLLPLDSAVVRTLIERFPYYSPGAIPAVDYPALDADVPTLSVLNWIVARHDLEDDVVETLLNVLANDRDTLRAAVHLAGTINLANLHAAPVPLHDAARRWLDRGGRMTGS